MSSLNCVCHFARKDEPLLQPTLEMGHLYYCYQDQPLQRTQFSYNKLLPYILDHLIYGLLKDWLDS